MRDLGSDDLLAVRRVLRQRFFAEYVFAVFQALEHIARVARVGGRDDDRLHLGRGDQLLAGLVGAQALVLRGGLARRFLEIVRARDDLTAGHQIVQTADMVAADRAAADDTNVQHEKRSFSIGAAPA